MVNDMSRSIRKGCKHCGGPLKNWREKITRTCEVCAAEIRESFAKVGSGDFKEGSKEIMGHLFKRRAEREDASKLVKQALSTREEKIRKKLKRQGLSEAEIDEGLRQYNKAFNVKEVKK